MPDEFDTGAFVRTPAWHQMGVVLPEPVPPFEMQHHAELDWDVTLAPIFAVAPDGKDLVEVRIEDQFATVRTDIARPLGVVGSKYEVIQNDMIFEFLDAMLDDDDVQMETAGLLVLADRWDQGWQAYLSGRPVPILIANHAIRGVVVPAGEATLELRYEPQSLVWGIRLAMFAGGVLLLGTAADSWVRRKRGTCALQVTQYV